MTTELAAFDAKHQPRSVTIAMAHRYGMEPQAFEATLRATVVPANCSKEQFAAFLMVAKEYDLNPILKEIYAFPAKGGGIVPIVGVDGWMSIINGHKQFDGMEFVDTFDDEKQLTAITCQIFRKDRSHPTSVTEYMNECRRDTEPWKKWPARMLRHKAAIQAARYAFGFSGIMEPDEVERGDIVETKANGSVPPPPGYAQQEAVHPLSQITEQLKQSHAELDGMGEHTPTVMHPPITLPEEPEDKPVDPEAELGDPDDYLDDLEARMAATKTEKFLKEIWQEHLDVSADLMPPDREKAHDSYLKHSKRLSKK
jgi:phage recombination protein Bet